MSTIDQRFAHPTALLRGLPALLVGGLAVLAVGLLLDLAVHLIGGDHAGVSRGALVVHGVVLAGMALSVAGLAWAALTAGRATPSRDPSTTRRFER